MRAHLTTCPKRPAASNDVDRLGGMRKRKRSRPPGRRMLWGLWSTLLLAIWLWLAVARAFFAVALACQDRFDSLLLTWFQIESVPLNFLNDFLLENLALEAP